jgi:hypothetical protein
MGSVIWVRVEKPVFDLAGVILSSLGFTAICVALALVLGSVWGTWLILWRRGHPEGPAPALKLEEISRA